jgi:hypothetical protein
MLASASFGKTVSMRGEDFDFISNFSTLWAVFLGAVLATAGGLAGTQLEWHFERKRRERHAALFFGEVLSTLGVMLKITRDVYGVGDPFGPITIRMLRSTKREIDLYDRNRETLYDLSDADTRTRIHALILRINTPMDSVLDAHEEILNLERQLRAPDLPASHREELQARAARIGLSRTAAYESVMENAADIPPLLKELLPHAHQTFDSMSRAAGGPNIANINRSTGG